jgi:inorganic pyrophosphatase
VANERMGFADLSRIPEKSKAGHLFAVIETPKGSRNKYSFDEELGLFRLKSVLAAGAVFPFDFGFFPNSLGGDGDPLDVLVLMDDPAFPGCVLEVRLVSVIQAEQTERDGTSNRNDRLITVAAASQTHRDIESLDDISSALMDEIEHFFESFNEIKGKQFKVIKRAGIEEAEQVLAEARRNYQSPRTTGKTRAKSN